MAIYMKIDGIDGHVTAEKHNDWIELDAINFNVDRKINTIAGNAVSRESTTPTISAITVKKVMDKATPKIFAEACQGKAKDQVIIHICQTDDNINPYMEYTLRNVLISNYQIDAQNKCEGGAPTESLSLNFDKIEMKYTPYDQQHKAGGSIVSAYDLKMAQKA